MINRVLLSIATVVVAVVSLAGAAPAGRLPVTVLERSCLYPTDAELSAPVAARAPDGTRVELWCGTRLEVSGGRCAVRLGDQVTPVPCVGGQPVSRSRPAARA